MGGTLAGKVALVTAASRGIGFGIAKALHADGAMVVICGRDLDRLREAEKTLNATELGRAFALAGDVGDRSFLVRLVEETRGHFGAIDILVNNNGGPPAGDILSRTEEQWAEAVERNLLSAVRLSSLVVPDMRERKWGRIINLASTTAKEPDEGMVLSNVTRAGVAAFAKTAAREFGPWGITVNTILTGGCLTERMRSLVEQECAASGEPLDLALRRIEELFPVRYVPDPDEFAGLIAFLASPAAGFVNGAAIPLDGGFTRSTF